MIYKGSSYELGPDEYRCYFGDDKDVLFLEYKKDDDNIVKGRAYIDSGLSSDDFVKRHELNELLSAEDVLKEVPKVINFLLRASFEGGSITRYQKLIHGLIFYVSRNAVKR